MEAQLQTATNAAWSARAVPVVVLMFQTVADPVRIVGVTAAIDVGEPGSVDRSAGKAVRVIDNRE